MSFIGSIFKRKHDSLQSEKPTLWIGIDYGTATIECVIRLEHRKRDDEVFVLATSVDHRGGVRVITPSVIESNGNAITCPTALSRRGGYIENIKYGLLSEAKESNLNWSVHGSAGRSVLILADILRLARKAGEHYAQCGALQVHLNVAAPTNSDKDDPTTQRVLRSFHEVSYRALILSEKMVSPELSMTQANELLDWSLSQSVPGPQQSPVTVVPEALAAVASFLLSPGREKGYFATLDIGGGTTDLSFFWFQASSSAMVLERKAWYYTMHTVPVGTQQLLADETFRDTSKTGAGTSHEYMGVSTRQNPPSEESSAFVSLKNHLISGYRDAWRFAYARHQKMSDWHTQSGKSVWELLLLGGGSAITSLRDQMAQSLPFDAIPWIKDHQAVSALLAPRGLDILLPSGKLDVGVTGRKAYGDHRHMFSLAFGLSHRTPDIPAYEEMESWSPPKVVFRDPPGHVSFDT